MLKSIHVCVTSFLLKLRFKFLKNQAIFFFICIPYRLQKQTTDPTKLSVFYLFYYTSDFNTGYHWICWKVLYLFAINNLKSIKSWKSFFVYCEPLTLLQGFARTVNHLMLVFKTWTLIGRAALF